MSRGKQCLAPCRLSPNLVTYHQEVASIPLAKVSRESFSVSSLGAHWWGAPVYQMQRNRCGLITWQIIQRMTVNAFQKINFWIWEYGTREYFWWDHSSSHHLPYRVAHTHIRSYKSMHKEPRRSVVQNSHLLRWILKLCVLDTDLKYYYIRKSPPSQDS